MSTVEAPAPSSESTFSKAAEFLKKQAEERAAQEAELKKKKDEEEAAKKAEKEAKKASKTKKKDESKEEKPVVELPNLDLVRERVTSFEKRYLDTSNELEARYTKDLSEVEAKVKAMTDELKSAVKSKYDTDKENLRANCAKGVKVWNDFLKHAGAETVKVVDELMSEDKVGDVVAPVAESVVTPEPTTVPSEVSSVPEA